MDSDLYATFQEIKFNLEMQYDLVRDFFLSWVAPVLHQFSNLVLVLSPTNGRLSVGNECCLGILTNSVCNMGFLQAL